MTGISLVVGLGNPGSEYKKTRHNAGFWFVDRLVAERSGQFSHEPKFFGDVARLQVGGKRLFVLKPSTFMNKSGQAVASLSSYFEVPPSEVLVVHDDLDLNPGSVRLKLGGGHGGHNGLRDIASHLGTKDFVRVRVGIGHPGGSSKVLNYVLGKPSKGDSALIEEGFDRAFQGLGSILDGDFQKAMSDLNSI
jgi:PTH1 family peptidyl-tRNA hydrolase